MEDQNIVLLRNLIDVADEISKSLTSNRLDGRKEVVERDMGLWVLRERGREERGICGWWMPWESFLPEVVYTCPLWPLPLHAGV
uniref:Uncharacterized protein n=1 Tax=Fagus sylvatica TaxID=28930 RepID=A0A2N9J1P9_FAGSY